MAAPMTSVQKAKPEPDAQAVSMMASFDRKPAKPM